MDYIATLIASVAVVILGAMWTHTAKSLRNGRKENHTAGDAANVQAVEAARLAAEAVSNTAKLVSDGFAANATAHALQAASNEQLSRALDRIADKMGSIATTMEMSCDRLKELVR